ncbi:Dual specificity phosphatase 28 [Phytophthora citrophthora]|uniref:Dual specificity phosphatase 28 n=1 Tax=Phytophthora citrophthora TaxID=4793 RepID=A0AAD9LER2_9STRA|nr:Dual specificity phosphatase 28 [Phytophthora citrophthora]
MDNLELQMRNLRFCIAYWELALLVPADEGEDDDAAWQQRLFREELAGFHQLVVNRVTHEDVMIHARESLRLVWKDCNGAQDDVANENWARVGPEDVKVGVENDLQLVAPGIWIGSTETLAYTNLLKDRDIQHLIYCTTTKRETHITREDASHLVVSLLDLPRQQFEEILAEADGVEQLKTLSSPSWNEISRIASTLNDLIGTRSDGRASRDPQVSGDGAVLLYCDSGMSASIAMCAALLLTRYNFPLDIVMSLIRAARRDILPSKHLWFQLEQLDRTLESASCHE